MLSPNQLSGRPTADLIPTLARLCACSVLMGGLAGQDSGCAALAKSFLREGGASACLNETGLTFVSPKDLVGGRGSPTALETPVCSLWRGTALTEAQLWMGAPCGRRGAGATAGVGAAARESWHPAGAQVLLLGCVPHRVSGPCCNAELLPPPPCVCRPRNLRWPFAYSLATAGGFLRCVERKGSGAHIVCSALGSTGRPSKDLKACAPGRNWSQAAGTEAATPAHTHICAVLRCRLV